VQSNPPAAKKEISAITEAKSQLAHGDLQGAENSLWTVLGSDQQNEDALMLLGEVRHRQQRVAEAEALYRRVLQINPKSVAGHRYLGQELVAQGKASDALEQYRLAVELAPNDVGLKTELARLYVGNGQAEQAVSTLATIPAAKFPVGAIPVKAAALIATGRKADAIHLQEQVRNSPGAELDLAEVYLGGQLPDEALHSLEIAAAGLKRPPARLHYLKGRALAEKGETEPALAALRGALAEDPKSADTLVALAEIYSAKNKHADAVAALQRAQALNPDSLSILRHLVVEATKANDSKAAVDAASALSDKSPNNPDDLYLAGAAMLQQNVQGASMVLEKFVVLRPDNARGWMGLGMAYVQQEHYDEARKPLERAIALDPALAEAEYELGLVAKNQAKADEAIRHLQRALQLQPKHVAALRTLGNLYLQSGELEKSKDELERAEAIDPNNVQTEYDLGLVCNKLGKTELARQHMEQFRKLKDAQGSDRHE
jgi:tetratricopeptide (TPR) repeat protein